MNSEKAWKFVVYIGIAFCFVVIVYAAQDLFETVNADLIARATQAVMP